MSPPLTTAWAVVCPRHGQVFLTRPLYLAQLDRPDEGWRCPMCGVPADWDDDNYEQSLDPSDSEEPLR